MVDHSDHFPPGNETEAEAGSFYMSLNVGLSFPLVPCSGELVQIMMATANEDLSAKFCNRVLKFFTKLFQLSE